MSSFCHQVYTRLWSRQLQTPIISVDYGKAPKHPYPEGLYDCFEAYMWVIFQLQQLYATNIKKIIFIGDSAGGNLAVCLINLLIEWNLPRPEGLVLAYPVLKITSDMFSPSLLHCIHDVILPHTYLKVCVDAYRKNN